MVNLIKGISDADHGWIIDAATGNRTPTALSPGELIAFLGGTYGDRLKWNLLTNKTEVDGIVLSED